MAIRGSKDEANEQSKRLEAEWIEGFAKGDPEARSRLFERYESRLYAFCRRILTRHEDAEDAVQETLLKASRTDSFRGTTFKAWIYKVALNVCRSQMRASIARSIREERTGLEVMSKPLESTHPRRTQEEREKARAVADAMDLLPAEQREVLVLKYIDDLTIEEIVEISGLSPSTIKGRLRHGRAALRRILEQRGIR